MLGFSEAERVDPAREADALAHVIEQLSQANNDAEPWRLKTISLELAGFLAGDIAFVDTIIDPKAQDAVCAQIFDYQRGSAETVWRIFDPPFLVGAAHDRTAYKPVLVDNERVKLHGVIVASLRPRRLSGLR